MKHLLFAPILLGFMSLVSAEISKEVYQKCINARDFLGCTKVYSDKKPTYQSRDIILLIDKININPSIDDYDKKHILTAFYLSYLKCLGDIEKKGRNVKISQIT